MHLPPYNGDRLKKKPCSYGGMHLWGMHLERVDCIWFSHYTKLLSSDDGGHFQDFVISDMIGVSPVNNDIF